MRTIFSFPKLDFARRFLPLLLFALLSAAAQAQFIYTTENGQITITGYNGPGGAVTIPSTIDGLPVTRIGGYAFYQSSLTSVMIPNSISTIGDFAFASCTNLSAITVDALNAIYSSMDGVLFNKSQTTLIQVPGGKAGGYTIPNSVTSIEHSAFWNCTSLTSVTIPSSVTTIGIRAFQYCTSLTSVTIPDGVTRIGDFAFAFCSGLTSVTIPKSVAAIGDLAFYSCGRLTSIEVDLLNAAYSSFEGVLFDKTRSTLLQYPGGKEGSYTIPNGVAGIGAQAFSGSGVSGVVFPDSLTIIKERAFSGCQGLTRIVIPASVSRIEEWAFGDCGGLTAVYCNGNAPALGQFAFGWWRSPPAIIYYLLGTTGWEETTGFYKSMWDPPSQFTIGVGDDQVIITGYLGLTNDLTIPGRIGGLMVSGIGHGAFRDRAELTSVTIPNTVTNIGDAAFARCFGLTSIAIPDSVITIGLERFSDSEGNTAAGAFGDCTGLTNVVIGNGVKSLGANSFSRCTGLSDIRIPNNITNIRTFAFRFCTSLTNVTLGSGVTSIGDGAFGGCTNLTSVNIPNSITNIGLMVFSRCSSLISVTIPDSVTTIESGAFEGCTSLTSVRIPNSVTTIGRSAFGGCASLTSVTIGNSVATIGPYAFGSCWSLISITIPKSVTSIESGAFAGCTSLTGVYFEGNRPSGEESFALFFDGADQAIVYYLPGTVGWDEPFGGRQAVLWNPQAVPSEPNFGVGAGRFGFTITGPPGVVIVVEACADLARADWTRVGTNTLTGGSSYFSDPQWTNYPSRIYRLRSP